MDENEYKIVRKKRKIKAMNPNSLNNLRPVAKGQVLNPNGSNGAHKEKTIVRKLTNEYLMEIINLAVMGNLEGLHEILDNPDSPALQVGLARAVVNAIKKGDWDLLERIIVRIVGKVPEKFDFDLKGLQVQFVKVEK